jgi:transcriptional regulator with XRE-family HTH domain
MDIGMKIKKLRENLKLSQEELAYQLEISQTKLSNIENGTTKKVGVQMLNKVCDFFGVDFDYFFDKKQVATPNGINGAVCVCVCV